MANEPRFADMPPARILPALADEAVSWASQSTFCRVLREHGQTQHRGGAEGPRTSRPPSPHEAAAPRQVRCWDMIYLPAPVVGRWFNLHLISDVHSRKIVPSRFTPATTVQSKRPRRTGLTGAACTG